MDPGGGCGLDEDRGKHDSPPAQMAFSATWPVV